MDLELTKQDILDVAEHNYEVPEIAEKLSKMIYEL